MTKPHTTLSEAVRAMELPEHSARVESQNETGSMATVWMNRTYGLLRDTKIYTEDQVRALLSVATDLVEKAEEEKPIDRAIRTGEPELFSFAPDQSSVRVVWPNGEVSLYVAESAEGQEPVAWIVYAEYEGVMTPQYPAVLSKDQAEQHAKMYISNARAEVRPLYTQPTLAATQAADAKMVDMILRDVAELEYTGLEDDTMEVTPADLRLIIERHMSPTTTRSE